jgi:hypothetical protein
MSTQDENVNRRDDRVAPLRIVEVAFFIVGILLFLTKSPLIDHLEYEYPTLGCVAVWVVGMLSYHQDARDRDHWWAFLSQTLAVVPLIGIVVFGFTHKSWLNFLIALPLVWLHIQFTRRWWARPGHWW